MDHLGQLDHQGQEDLLVLAENVVLVDLPEQLGRKERGESVVLLDKLVLLENQVLLDH